MWLNSMIYMNFPIHVIVFLKILPILLLCLLRSGNTVDKQVQGHPELSVKIAVMPDGFITFPLLSRIEAQGRTLEELAKEIETKLTAHMKDGKAPHIEITTVRFPLAGPGVQ